MNILNVTVTPDEAGHFTLFDKNIVLNPKGNLY